ncbi:hypothetical protein [Metabacillus idriensis]|uniref:hypothetical protein n=1 Tax=Metabacillus idriensis TaxID=324768 RepID=UPI00174C5E28|nr:hypothetical protein [Metabacillus idriensis]
MLSIGSIIFSDCSGEVFSKKVVHELREILVCEELFNIAWNESINPWYGCAYATLNLRTGELEGHDEFSMRRGTPYLILYKVSLESLLPEDILTDKELSEYEKFEQSLEQFCGKYEINIKQRAESYYQSNWDKISWYMDSVIEANLLEWYEVREVA